VIFLDGMVPLFNAALNKRVVAKLRKRPLTKKASKSGMFKVFRCGPERDFSSWCDGGPRWET
jgi:hypothetical protein